MPAQRTTATTSANRKRVRISETKASPTSPKYSSVPATIKRPALSPKRVGASEPTVVTGSPSGRQSTPTSRGRISPSPTRRSPTMNGHSATSKGSPTRRPSPTFSGRQHWPTMKYVPSPALMPVRGHFTAAKSPTSPRPPLAIHRQSNSRRPSPLLERLEAQVTNPVVRANALASDRHASISPGVRDSPHRIIVTRRASKSPPGDFHEVLHQHSTHHHKSPEGSRSKPFTWDDVGLYHHSISKDLPPPSVTTGKTRRASSNSPSASVTRNRTGDSPASSFATRQSGRVRHSLMGSTARRLSRPDSPSLHSSTRRTTRPTSPSPSTNPQRHPHGDSPVRHMPRLTQRPHPTRGPGVHQAGTSPQLLHSHPPSESPALETPRHDENPLFENTSTDVDIPVASKTSPYRSSPIRTETTAHPDYFRRWSYQEYYDLHRETPFFHQSNSEESPRPLGADIDMRMMSFRFIPPERKELKLTDERRLWNKGATWSLLAKAIKDKKLEDLAANMPTDSD